MGELGKFESEAKATEARKHLLGQGVDSRAAQVAAGSGTEKTEGR